LPFFSSGAQRFGRIDAKFNLLHLIKNYQVWFGQGSAHDVLLLLIETHSCGELMQLIDLSNDSFIMARAGRLAPRNGNSHDKTQTCLHLLMT